MLFLVYYLIEKQDYKLELLKKSRIYDIFYMLIPKEDITKKNKVDKKYIN